MRFYTGQHQYYCGIDLHARKMYTCIINQDGEKLFHKNLDSDPTAFLKAIKPYQDDLVVAAECMFAWYLPVPKADRLAFRPVPPGAHPVRAGPRPLHAGGSWGQDQK